MTITIPTWLLYTVYIVGGVIALGTVMFILALAYIGWAFSQAFKGGIWR